MALKKKPVRRFSREYFDSEEYKQKERARLAAIKEENYQRLVKAKLLSIEDKDKYLNPTTDEEKNQVAKLDFILEVEREILDKSKYDRQAYYNFSENFTDYEKSHKGVSALALIKDDIERYTNESFSNIRIHGVYDEQEKRTLVSKISSFATMPSQEKEGFLIEKNQKNAELEAMLADTTPINKQTNFGVADFKDDNQRMEQVQNNHQSEMYRMLEESRASSQTARNLEYYHQHLEKK